MQIVLFTEMEAWMPISESVTDKWCKITLGLIRLCWRSKCGQFFPEAQITNGSENSASTWKHKGVLSKKRECMVHNQ